MCKIDYLGTGVCPSGRTKQYVSYYPQGRMDLYDALGQGLIPVTEGLMDIAHTCTLCGICDPQCHFYTGLRPMIVMRALKEYAESYGKQKGEIKRVPEDSCLKQLREIVGPEWATNDPAILVTYAHDPFPLAATQMPRYVVLPRTGEEIAKLVRFSKKSGVPYVVRGNGGSVYGAVFTDGIVVDTNRMKGIHIDRENWSVTAEAGVTSFDLQRAVHAHGLRINAAEPAATVCGNIVCSGIFSTWSNVYGTCADHLIDGEFVDGEGKIFSLNQKEAPNVYAFKKEVGCSPGILTQAVIPVHPTTNDEEGLLIPTANFEEAVALARDLSQRRIGLAIGILGNHYLSTFISPSADLAEKIKRALSETLGIRYTVFVVGDRYARQAIREMTKVVLGEKALRILMLGLPKLLDGEWTDLIQNFESNQYPFEIFCKEEMLPVLEAVLRPSPENLASVVEEDLRDFYVQLYSRREMTSLVWLNSFRIVSARMGRHKHPFAFLVYVPLDRVEVIQKTIAEFARVADCHHLEHDYGFLTPLDLGKRGILEYDYYLDHTDEGERKKARKALEEIEPFLEEMTRKVKGFMNFKYVFSQGCCRKEGFLYMGKP